MQRSDGHSPYSDIEPRRSDPSRDLGRRLVVDPIRDVPDGCLARASTPLAPAPNPTDRRQPGAFACVATIAAVSFRLGEEVLCWVLAYLTRPRSAVHLPSPPFVRFDNPGYHPPPGQWFRNVLLEAFPILVSPSVAVAVSIGWCVLRAGGQWRPDAGWIDRSGRWLGWFWIGLGIALATLIQVGKFIG